MCLTISIEVDQDDRERLITAGQSAAQFGLRVEVRHSPRWPWAKTKPVRATISEEGGCACGMLSDDADWDADTWAMRPEVIEPLAHTLEWLVERGPDHLVVEALWAGERAVDERHVDHRELGQIVRTAGLGTKTKYMVSRKAI